MLGGNYNSIGIACVEYNGRKFWVQEFSSEVHNTNPVTYSEDSQRMTVTPLKSLISLSVQFADAGYRRYGTAEIGQGESLAMPEINGTVVLKNPGSFSVQVEVSAVSKDESIVKIENNRIFGVSGGTAEVVFTADYMGIQKELSLKVTVTGHEHDYVLDHWDWADDYSSAEAVFVCSSDSSHVYRAAAKVTSERKEPTCTKEGSAIYTASVTVSGKEYTDTKTKVLPMLDHDWGEIEYTWSDDYKTATASVTCRAGGEKEEETVNTIYEVIKEPATETEGLGRYTAAFTNKRFYTQIKEVVIPALEHDHEYEFSEMVWSDSYRKAEAVFICAKNPEHVLRIPAEVTSGIVEPTCRKTGFFWYSATVEYGNTT
jgi:hypothetical protein